MSNAEIVLVANVVFALIAGFGLASAGRRQKSGPLRTSSAPAVLRFATIDGAAVAPRDVTVRLAPLDRPGVAFEVTGLLDEPRRRAHIRAEHVRELHLWVRGRSVPVLAVSDPAAVMPALAGDVAGWELHIATEFGQTIRCYGTRINGSLELDLARLRRLVAAHTQDFLATAA